MKKMANEFLKKRVLTNKINVFDTIPKNIDQNLVVRAPLPQKNSTTVEVNRNILGKLLN